MFTGIVQAVGRLAASEGHGVDRQMRIATGQLDLQGVRSGDSIAVSGVCLTAIELQRDGFRADVSAETLACTTLGDLAIGDPVNLEKALTLATPLGGHLVSGHVDGVGTVQERRDEGRSVRFTVEAPADLARYIAAKGSICIDGVSLTVNAVQSTRFELNIVPHTLGATTWSTLVPGRRVNLEVDLLARYLERLLLGSAAQQDAGAGVTRELLERYGYLRV